MALYVYNTLKRNKEEFKPIQEGRVGMYLCGPTVYDSAHIGHARCAVVFDVIYRYLKYIGYEVTFVRNITDIEDKIIDKAQREGVDWRMVAKRYTDEYLADMAALGVEEPTHQPHATEHIAGMHAIITKLIERGHAYRAGGDVYFSVSSFNKYGALSRRTTEELQAGARVAVDEAKRAPEDFALWKSAKPGEPSWPSPWGDGRPGWHIECSAMSTCYLGETIDIHGGGNDLVFPHHENEIAQSECAQGVKFVNYWLHNGMVTVDQEKMSKSLRNFVTISDILAQYHPEVVRLFLLGNHYRSPVDFSPENMAAANQALERAYLLLEKAAECREEPRRQKGAGPKPSGSNSVEDEAEERFAALPALFSEAMDDDFNTAAAQGHIFDAFKALGSLLAHFTDAERTRTIVTEALAAVEGLGQVLGIFASPPAEFLRRQQELLIAARDLDAAAIDEKVAQRAEARARKDWAAADALRDELAALHVALEDGPDGTAWRVLP